MIWIIGFLFISFTGTILHFVYDFSKHNKIVALFSSVNESTWEHIKIALTPTFIWSLVDGYIYGTNPNYFTAKLVGILAIIIIIPLIFYTYTFLIKKRILIIDILSFYIAIFASQIGTYLVLNTIKTPYLITYISIILLVIILGIYLTSTFLPIKNFLFKDPKTKKYGIKGHRKTRFF